VRVSWPDKTHLSGLARIAPACPALSGFSLSVGTCLDLAGECALSAMPNRTPDGQTPALGVVRVPVWQLLVRLIPLQRLFILSGLYSNSHRGQPPDGPLVSSPANCFSQGVTLQAKAPADGFNGSLPALLVSKIRIETACGDHTSSSVSTTVLFSRRTLKG
jgi:hypothetical protein